MSDTSEAEIVWFNILEYPNISVRASCSDFLSDVIEIFDLLRFVDPILIIARQRRRRLCEQQFFFVRAADASICASPSPFFGIFHELRPRWIALDILQHCQQVTVLLYDE